jgi:hypothetical protein
MNSLTMWLAFFFAKTLAFQHAINSEVFLLADVVGSTARGVNMPSSTAPRAPAARGVMTPSPAASGAAAAAVSATNAGLAQELVTDCDDEAQHDGEDCVFPTSKLSTFSKFNEFDACDVHGLSSPALPVLLSSQGRHRGERIK